MITIVSVLFYKYICRLAAIVAYTPLRTLTASSPWQQNPTCSNRRSPSCACTPTYLCSRCIRWRRWHVTYTATTLRLLTRFDFPTNRHYHLQLWAVIFYGCFFPFFIIFIAIILHILHCVIIDWIFGFFSILLYKSLYFFFSNELENSF